MYEDINKQLEKLKEGIQRVKKINSKIEGYKQDKQRLEKKFIMLKDQLDKENHDVERFEKANVSTIFYKILGSYETQAEKERQEALAAKLKYDQCDRELKEIKYQLTKLAAEKLKFRHYSNDYENLYQEKLQMLKDSKSRDAAKVMDFTEKLAGVKANLTEIQEAIEVGDKVVDCLQQASSSLKSAQGWGVWDMLGGGLVSSFAKHSHIDKARDKSSEIQNLLRQFKNELTDIELTTDISIDISSFSKFADFFFDGLIADWFVQSKINSAQDSVDRVKNQLDNVIAKLYEMKSIEKNILENYQNKLNLIIERS